MRGTLDGLDSPLPLGLQLPGVYQEDEFAQRLLGAFDAVLAPVLATLDGLAGYVDPQLAPEDFLGWLAGWVGVSLDDSWTPAARRAVVAQAVSLHRRRGTADGLADQVRTALGAGCEVEVVESGAATWSASPGAPLPGEAAPSVVVRVVPPEGGTVPVARLRALVARSVPAHVPVEVEVLGR